MSVLIDVLSWICLVGGGLMVITGGIGMVRFPDFFTRIHAASLTDTLGAGLVVLGLMLQAGIGLVTIKLALIIAFLIFTGPVATHALAKAALHGHVEPVPGESSGDPSSNC